MKGLSPRIFFASLSITSSDAPTKSATSILLMINRSDFVIPGPPLRGILSPAETSITYKVKSDNSGLNVALRLSPPLSKKLGVDNRTSAAAISIRILEG